MWGEFGNLLWMYDVQELWLFTLWLMRDQIIDILDKPVFVRWYMRRSKGRRRKEEAGGRKEEREEKWRGMVGGF
jgi:hypothetical protein